MRIKISSSFSSFNLKWTGIDQQVGIFEQLHTFLTRVQKHCHLKYCYKKFMFICLNSEDNAIESSFCLLITVVGSNNYLIFYKHTWYENNYIDFQNQPKAATALAPSTIGLHSILSFAFELHSETCVVRRSSATLSIHLIFGLLVM